jgi:hypothetical protein
MEVLQIVLARTTDLDDLRRHSDVKISNLLVKHSQTCSPAKFTGMI